MPRPRGVDRRDTVPIWAQPGEFMMRVDAVKKYGLMPINESAMERLIAGGPQAIIQLVKDNFDEINIGRSGG